MLRVRLALPAIVIASTLVGCAHHAQHHSTPDFRPSAEMLPGVERGQIVGEVDEAAKASGTDSPLAAPVGYRGLTAAECQCFAVEASVLGKLLDRECWTCCLHDMKPSEQRARCTQLGVLRAAANEARNKNAADALRLYYGIAEAEAARDAVDDGLAEIADVTAKIESLRSEKLTVPFDASEWTRQRLALEAKRAELEATLLKLNSQLRSLLGCESTAEATRFFPTEPLIVGELGLVAGVEVAYGLETRPELQATRILATSDPEAIVQAVRGLLGGMHGLMGVATRTAASQLTRQLLGLNDGEANVRQRQIAEYDARRRSQVADEIAAAVATVELRKRQAILALEQTASWRRRIDELRQKHEVDQASFVELAEARLKLVDAQQATTAAAINWKRSLVDLREAQGALVAECRGCALPPSSTAPGRSVLQAEEPPELLPPAIPSAKLTRIEAVDLQPVPPQLDATTVAVTTSSATFEEPPPVDPRIARVRAASLFAPPPLASPISNP